jgi:hypothetical protein
MGLMTTKSGGGRFAALLGGIGLGAAVMYVLDPEGGRRRRALARDKAVSLANKTTRVVEAKSRDLANRAKGVAAEARSKMGDRAGNGGDERREESNAGNGGENFERGPERQDEGSF